VNSMPFPTHYGTARRLDHRNPTLRRRHAALARSMLPPRSSLSEDALSRA